MNSDIPKLKVNALENVTSEPLILAQRHYCRFEISGDSQSLVTAERLCEAEIESNPASLRAYFFRIYLLSLQGDSNTAQKLLERLRPNRNYFKNSVPDAYGAFLFLSALLEIAKSRNALAKKTISMLAEYNNEQDRPVIDIYLCRLYSLLGLYDASAGHAVYAYKKGSQANFLYLAIMGILKDAPVMPSSLTELVIPFLTWAVSQGVNLDEFLSKHQRAVSALLTRKPKLFEEIYRLNKPTWLLSLICSNLIEHGDTSPEAFYFYREAAGKQVEVPKLNEYIIRSAHKNKAEDVSRYSMQTYLSSRSEIDPDLQPYIYHLVLTGKKHREFAPALEPAIKQFAIDCIEQGLSGRYYLSLYKFLTETCAGDPGLKFTIIKAQELLYNSLFSFEIEASDPRAGYVWVYEKEKKDMTLYRLLNSKAVISASSDAFGCYFVSENQKSIIDSDLTATRLVENAGMKLLRMFFEQGISDTNLFIEMSRQYMALERIPDEAIPVFEKTISDNKISKHLRMQVTAALGFIYASRSMDKRAVEYFRETDENAIPDKYLDQMLLTYVSAFEYRRAVNLIVKKSEWISERSLFYALKQIALQKEYDAEIANVAYELILKNWYDKHLISIVLSHYNGSQEEWQALSSALLSMSAAELSLDELILKNAITMHMLDRGSQDVFRRMAENNTASLVSREFAIYMMYEILINQARLDNETLAVLEKLFFTQDLNKHRNIWLFGLSTEYLLYDIYTPRSDEIIALALEACEEMGILLPVFKQKKDKIKAAPYIEKNQPFITKGLPERKINLCYRTDPNAEYRKKEMRYLFFGLFAAIVPHFYGEKIEYCFSEEMPSGSIVSVPAFADNQSVSISNVSSDPYYLINDALVYEQMFKYNKVEEIISERLSEKRRVRGWIL